MSRHRHLSFQVAESEPCEDSAQLETVETIFANYVKYLATRLKPRAKKKLVSGMAGRKTVETVKKFRVSCWVTRLKPCENETRQYALPDGRATALEIIFSDTSDTSKLICRCASRDESSHRT